MRQITLMSSVWESAGNVVKLIHRIYTRSSWLTFSHHCVIYFSIKPMICLLTALQILSNQRPTYSTTCPAPNTKINNTKLKGRNKVYFCNSKGQGIRNNCDNKIQGIRNQFNNMIKNKTMISVNTIIYKLINN